MVVAFIDDRKDRFGVEPICHLLTAHGVKIAPSTYYAHKTRRPSARSASDERLLDQIIEIFSDPKWGRELYGARKMCHQLRREGVAVARCTVERLMRRGKLRGARRGRQVFTTHPDPAATRPADLVNRKFVAGRPNQLWVVDLTYVATWTGTAFAAFVSDVCSRRIVG